MAYGDVETVVCGIPLVHEQNTDYRQFKRLTSRICACYYLLQFPLSLKGTACVFLSSSEEQFIVAVISAREQEINTPSLNDKHTYDTCLGR